MPLPFLLARKAAKKAASASSKAASKTAASNQMAPPSASRVVVVQRENEKQTSFVLFVVGIATLACHARYADSTIGLLKGAAISFVTLAAWRQLEKSNIGLPLLLSLFVHVSANVLLSLAAEA